MSVLPLRNMRVFFCFLALLLVVSPIPSRCELAPSGKGSSLPLSTLSISEEIGKVQERFEGHSPRTIIQIQDVHAHVIAQQNIAAILERLRTVFDVEKVAVEGAWSSTSLPKSHSIPTSREKQLLAQTLLEDDLISGPVYASIMSPDPIALSGIEEETLYEKNRSLFIAHLAKNREILEKLKAYEASIKDQQSSSWGPDLLSLGNALGKFRENADLGKFFPAFLKTAEAQGSETADLSQVTLLRDIMALEKTFEKKRLEQEVGQLMKEYKNTPWTIEELVRGGKIPPEKLGFYPEVKKLTRLYEMRDKVSLQELTAQIETLIGRVIASLAKTPEARELWEKTGRFYLARKILLLQATPADLKAFENEKTLLASELAAAGLTDCLSLSLDFYETVKRRDAIFFDRITTDPSLSGNIAVVTGGFHTEGLSARLREAGISYITVTPELGGTGMNEKLYERRMIGDGSEIKNSEKPKASLSPSAVSLPTSSTLSELRNGIEWIDEKFPGSYEVLMQTRDVRRAKAAFLGKSVTVSENDRIAHLAREGKVLPEQKGVKSITASGLRVSEFRTKPRTEQLESVRGWLAQGKERHQKAMLVSSVSVLGKMLADEKVPKLLEQIAENGDILALVQDIPATEMSGALLSARGIERFEVPDVATLIEKTPRFGRAAKKHPFAIMKDDYQGGGYVVLPEKPVSLLLYRIVTLNPNLYQAAKDPAFVLLLEDLVTDILSQNLSGKSA